MNIYNKITKNINGSAWDFTKSYPLYTYIYIFCIHLNAVFHLNLYIRAWD